MSWRVGRADPVGHLDRLGLGVHAELAQDALDVRADGVAREHEAIGHVIDGQARAKEVQ